MARTFIRRERDTPSATTLPKNGTNPDMIARIEAYTLPPFADRSQDADEPRFARLTQPALLRTSL